MRSNQYVTVAAFAALLSFSSVATALAVDDHLACFKVKSQKLFDDATVDLASALPGYDFAGCRVTSKAAQLCVPVAKTVVSLTNGTPVTIAGDDAVWQRVCYKVKCPGAMPTETVVTDQFGTQALVPVKLATICTPAVPGSCVDLDGDTYGAGCNTANDCDDADATVNPAATETCDSVDDDCDGTVDDSPTGTGAACGTGLSGPCASGTTVCSGGAFVCQASVGVAEICNNQDDDCDGLADEDFPDKGAPCTADALGVCASGTRVCGVGGLLVCQVGPGSFEICDGLDNDCNGTIDNNIASGYCNTNIPGQCAYGSYQCNVGTWVCVQTDFPSTEICDALDNDCNGATDELTRSCYTGPAGTAGVGICRAGAQPCSNGSWSPSCPGQVVPFANEILGDGNDENCNGSLTN